MEALCWFSTCVGAPVSGNGIIMEIRPRNQIPAAFWPVGPWSGATFVKKDLCCFKKRTNGPCIRFGIHPTCCSACNVKLKHTFSPCKSVKSFITALWNRHLPKWRRRCRWISDSILSPTFSSFSSFFTSQQLLHGRPTRPGRLSQPPYPHRFLFFSQLCPQYQRFPVQDANLRTVRGRQSQRKFVTKWSDSETIPKAFE